MLDESISPTRDMLTLITKITRAALVLSISRLSQTAVSLMVGIDLVLYTVVEPAAVLLLYLRFSSLLCPD